MSHQALSPRKAQQQPMLKVCNTYTVYVYLLAETYFCDTPRASKLTTGHEREEASHMNSRQQTAYKSYVHESAHGDAAQLVSHDAPDRTCATRKGYVSTPSCRASKAVNETPVSREQTWQRKERKERASAYRGISLSWHPTARGAITVCPNIYRNLSFAREQR